MEAVAVVLFLYASKVVFVEEDILKIDLMAAAVAEEVELRREEEEAALVLAVAD